MRTFQSGCWLLVLALLAGPGARAQEPPAVRATAQGLLLDFQDADLRLVLSALGEAGHLNLVYSELPSRHVTLRTNQAVPVEQILPLLKSLAASNGLKLTEDGAFVRIEDTGQREARPGAAKDTAAQSELRLFVYRLKHARAVRLASTLQAIFGGAATRESGQGSYGPATLSEGLRQQQVPPMDTTQAPRVNVQLGPVRAPGLPARLQGEVQIVPDEATNSLLIRAQASDWEIIQETIQTLDLRPLQVLIEVLIAEVRHSKDFNLGVSARVGSDSGATGNTASASLQGSSTGDFALRVMRLGRVNVDVAISALASTGDVRIVSRPVLLAQNNQESRILIGSERPFVQVFRSLPTDAAVRDQVIQYRDVGTKLTLTPTINEDGYVNLQVVQEVSNATNETQFGAPIISTREAATHLFVRDGQTAVIGGLVDHEIDRTRSGVPLLKDLPLVGGLFGSTQTTDAQSELFLFVTPHIVASDDAAERLREGLDQGAPLLRQVPKGSLFPPPADSTRQVKQQP
ncbi:MAG TPA: secretin N-terminal domain-containing protein [Gemmatimonadales bacterium]|jgi:general secretion pathway protein D